MGSVRACGDEQLLIRAASKTCFGRPRVIVGLTAQDTSIAPVLGGIAGGPPSR